jgi:hypothetical protein
MTKIVASSFQAFLCQAKKGRESSQTILVWRAGDGGMLARAGSPGYLLARVKKSAANMARAGK